METLEDWWAAQFVLLAYDSGGVVLVRDTEPGRAESWVLYLGASKPLASDLAAALALVPPGEHVEVWR